MTFFEDMIRAELDTIVAQGNFEDAFGISRGNRQPRTLRRELLKRMYDLRSGFVHAGLDPSYQGMGMERGGASLRRGLLSDFVEAAILAYLDRPRSRLVGHPVLDPDTNE